MVLMNLSTSTNIISHPRKGETLLSVQECVELCAAQGYQVMDINCCDCAEPGFPLTMDDWQRWTEKLANVSKALGVTYSQSHNPIYNMLEPSEVEDFAWQEELSDRCLIAAAMLGVKWVVVHAGTALPGGVYNRRMTLEKNAEYFSRMASRARSLGMDGIAIENMAYFGTWSATLPPQLCATTEGLIELVDLIHMDSVGICWDFGHAHLGHEDQAESLRRIGSRLKATHVSDNKGQADDHTLPFLGSIDWESVLPALTEIGYTGDFTYEIHKYMRNAPQALYPALIKASFDVGQHLIRLSR